MVNKTENQKWILTVRELHLGHCKETFRAGAVIELDELRNQLIIDGRKFDDTRDLDVLLRHDMKFPNAPWIIPYSKEARQDILMAKGSVPSYQEPIAPLDEDQRLRIIKSDEDLNEPIDIRSTQLSKVHAAEKEAVRLRVKKDGMEIIRGDETVEERLASLKDKTDIGSIGERARLKASGAVKMPIVHDDSLGAGYGSKSASLNAGQHIVSREEAESKRAEALAFAEARKREADKNRRSIAPVEIEGTVEQQSEQLNATAEVIPAKAASMSDSEAQARSENEVLKARLDKMEKMLIAQQGAASKRGKKARASKEG